MVPWNLKESLDPMRFDAELASSNLVHADFLLSFVLGGIYFG